MYFQVDLEWSKIIKKKHYGNTLRIEKKIIIQILTSNKMAQIWNNLQLNNAKSIVDVRASALEWYRTNLQN